MKRLYKKIAVLAAIVFMSFGLFAQRSILSDTIIYDTICEGYDYDNYGFFVILPEAGLYEDSLTYISSTGEDSTVYLSLLVNPSYEINLTETINYGEDYDQNGFYIIQPEVGLFYDTLFLFSMQGCDSTVYLVLNVLEPNGIVDNGISTAEVYPNPTTDNIVVECDGLKSVVLMNNLGSVIFEISNINNDKYPLELNNYPEGVYYIRINTKEGEVIRKVVKTK